MLSEPTSLEHTSETEPERLYADAFTNPLTDPPAPDVYRKADPAEVITPDRTRFYDVEYRPKLSTMIDHVIAVEGPMYFHVLVERISRAHGFQRAKGMIRDTITFALGQDRFPQSKDDGYDLIWPLGAGH